MKVSIIYVNWNTTELTADSIRSLDRLKGLFDFEVIVVDNATTDFDVAAFKRAQPGVKVVESGSNLGFGKGNNLGAKEGRGEYLWILNTDTLVPEDHHLDKLVAFLDEHPEYGAATPKLTDADGRVQPAQVAHFPTPARMVMRTVDYDRPERADADVEVAVAAALFVRRSVFEEVGGFSPEFFMFYEDSDLCRKIWQAGHKIRFVAEVHMVHLWGQSIKGKKSFARRKELYFQSQDVYLRKWHSPAASLLIKCLRWPLMLRYRLLNR